MQRRQSWGPEGPGPQYNYSGPLNNSAVTCHEVGCALTTVWHVGPIMQHFWVQNQ